MPSPIDTLRDLLGPDLQHVAGTSVSGELPVTDTLINRLIAEHLAAADVPVAAAQVEAHDAGALTAHVTLRAPSFVPTVRVAVQIDQQPDLPESPVLGIRWTLPGLGLLARFAAPALALFNALPPGVTMEGDRVRLNLRQLLDAQGLGDLLRYLAALHVTTRAGSVVVRFDVRVPPSG